MSDFRTLTETMLVAPQISPADIAQAKAAGVTMVINNRPEGESDDQTPGSDIEAAAVAAGLAYRCIPIDHSGFSPEQVRAMASALDTADGSVLAYCRSGTRSTLLWALAMASKGEDPAAIAEAAARGGYDVSIIADSIEQLARRAAA